MKNIGIQQKLVLIRHKLEKEENNEEIIKLLNLLDEDIKILFERLKFISEKSNTIQSLFSNLIVDNVLKMI